MGDRPIRVLNVAEKPSAAREITSILSSGNRVSTRNTQAEYMRVAEFDYAYNPQPPERSAMMKMKVTSVRGHMINYDFPDEYRKNWQSCDPVEMFSLPLVSVVSDPAIERVLQAESRNVDWLVLWLDGDREGESISFEVLDACRKVNPNLVVKRARFSSFTPRDILRAMLTLDRPNVREAEAVQFRQELDLRAGTAFTRWMCLRLKPQFPALKDQLISYGPCQFPTLGFVVQRQQRIDAFKPETFHSITMTHNGISFNWDRSRLYDRLSTFVLFDRCYRASEAIVKSVVKRRTSKWRPVPLNTVELQKLASTRLHLAAEKTMEIAEALYQKGFLSYPRTETDIFTPATISDDELRQICSIQTASPAWGEYARSLVETPGMFQRPRAGRNDDKAHPPIHPVKYCGEFDNDDHRRLYELVARHYLACCSQDAVGAETVVRVVMGVAATNDAAASPEAQLQALALNPQEAEWFTATGLIVEQPNYLQVYTYDRWTSTPMPNYVENQRFVPSALRMTDGRTAPPGPLSEADLISTMDRNGIGTDATIATHIKTIQDRSYVTRQGNSFKPTNLGRAIIEGYKDMDLGALWKPTLRAKMESDMKLVGQGRMTKAAALAANIEMYRAAFIVARSKGYVLDQSVSKYFPRDPDAFVQFEIGRPCDGCARPLLVRKTKEGKYLIACPGKPVCQARPLWLSQCAKKISAAPVAANDNAVCPTCGAHKVHIQVDEARVPPRWPFMSTEVDCCLYCNRDARACLVG